MRLPTLTQDEKTASAGVLEKLATQGIADLAGPKKGLATKLIGDPNGDHIMLSDRVTTDVTMPRGCACQYAEVYHQAILFALAHDDYSLPLTSFRKGLIILIEREPIGFVKLKGDKTLLAARTVKDSKGRFPLVRGGIYAVRRSLWEGLNKRHNWRVRELTELRVNPIRAIYLRETLRYNALFKKKLDLSERLDRVMEGAKKAYEGSWLTRVLEGYEILG